MHIEIQLPHAANTLSFDFYYKYFVFSHDENNISFSLFTLVIPLLPQLALHLLGCLDVLTWAHESGLGVAPQDPKTQGAQARTYTREDYTPVNR